jgi:hypothetical protein
MESRLLELLKPAMGRSAYHKRRQKGYPAIPRNTPPGRAAGKEKIIAIVALKNRLYAAKPRLARRP